MKKKRVDMKKEPVLKGRHRWLVKVLFGRSETVSTYLTKKEVRKLLDQLPPGSRAHVYKISFNFVEAWQI